MQTISNAMQKLSGYLVGFWHFETIGLALRLNLFDHLPSSLEDLEQKLSIPKENLSRLLRALWELDLVESGPIWQLSEMGLLLQSDQPLASAAKMWAQVQGTWESLDVKLRSKPAHHPTFKELSNDPKALETYKVALDGYALSDFADIGRWPTWATHPKIAILGQTGITLARLIRDSHPIDVITLNEDLPIYQGSTSHFIKPKEPWNIDAYAVIFPRYLHYYPDEDAIQILQRAKEICDKIYVFEMLLDPNTPSGALLDLNMLAEAGGGLRTLDSFEKIFTAAGFQIEKTHEIQPHLHLIIGDAHARRL